jgi:dTDP-4-amino-4,6-dideoxygalactose transaminase
MIPNCKPCFNSEEIKSLFYSNKNVIDKFEENFAKTVGSKYAISFPYGRSGLYGVLKCMEIKNSDIIMPSFTSITVPSTILASKNTPRFVDISLEDYNMVIDNILSCITKRTKAIIPTHMYGYPFDVKELREKINRENILIIEDAASAFLTKKVGIYSDFTFYSLSDYKQLSTLGGGVVTTNDPDFYEKLKGYVNNNFFKSEAHTDFKKLIRFFFYFLVFNNYFYKISNIRINYSKKNFYANFQGYQKHILKDFLQLYSRFQAKIGLAQLKKAHEIIRKRERIAKFYDQRLQHLETVFLPPIINGASYSEYTIRINNRDLFKREMMKKGCETDSIFSYSLPHLDCFGQCPNHEFANSLTAAEGVVNLPCYPDILNNSKMLQYIGDFIEDSLNNISK